MKTAQKRPFTVRSALILLISVLGGLTFGGLTLLAGSDTATAVLAGLSAAAASVVGADALIGDEN